MHGKQLKAKNIETFQSKPRDPEAVKKGQPTTCPGCGAYWPCPTIRALNGEVSR